MQPTSRTLLALGLLAVLLAACGQAATPATAPTVAPASPTTILTSTPAPTITTAPALTVGEAETLVAQIQPTPCAPATHIPSGLHPGVQVGERHADRAVSASTRGAHSTPLSPHHRVHSLGPEVNRQAYSGHRHLY
jgi:hypothetical protein